MQEEETIQPREPTEPTKKEKKLRKNLKEVFDYYSWKEVKGKTELNKTVEGKKNIEQM